MRGEGRKGNHTASPRPRISLASGTNKITGWNLEERDGRNSVVRGRPSGVLQQVLGAVMHRGQARLMQLPVPSSTNLLALETRARVTGGKEKKAPQLNCGRHKKETQRYMMRG